MSVETDFKDKYFEHEPLTLEEIAERNDLSMNQVKYQAQKFREENGITGRSYPAGNTGEKHIHYDGKYYRVCKDGKTYKYYKSLKWAIKYRDKYLGDV